MNLSEKSAYLKGLMDGLKLDQEAPEGKMISGIVELLQEVTGAIGDLQENAEAVSDELDEIEDDLDAIEDYLMDDDDEEDGFMDDDGEDFDYDDDTMYEVTCPKCGNPHFLTIWGTISTPRSCAARSAARSSIWMRRRSSTIPSTARSAASRSSSSSTRTTVSDPHTQNAGAKQIPLLRACLHIGLYCGIVWPGGECHAAAA